MIFQDNVIKEYLKNVLFITGTPCGGKTTVSRALARKYGIPVYDIDEQFEKHQTIADPEHQPNMCRQFRDADEFFGRSVPEYVGWLIGNTREQLDFVLLDLVRLSQNGKVICDCHLTLEQAKQITEPSRIAFLIKEPKNLVDDYCNRPDHQGFSDFIHSASDFEKAKAVCGETLYTLNAGKYEDIKKSGYFYVERDGTYNVNETVELVEKHFGLDKSSDIEIVKVEKGSADAEKLVQFVENFSWEDVRAHTLQTLRNWEFTDWETMFMALKDGKPIGMVSVMKEDYYPLPEVFPWISSVFVTEEYRGRKISGKLIAFAENYLKEQGFEKAYIPTEFTGLYEHFGYEYQGKIVNYGGGTDRLYVKDLK